MSQQFHFHKTFSFYVRTEFSHSVIFFPPHEGTLGLFLEEDVDCEVSMAFPVCLPVLWQFPFKIKAFEAPETSEEFEDPRSSSVL